MPQSSHSCGGLSHTKGDDDYCDDHDFDDYDADIESDDDKEEHLKIQSLSMSRCASTDVLMRATPPCSMQRQEQPLRQRSRGR